MALVRPPRKGKTVAQQLDSELALEAQILVELQGLKTQVRDFRMALMGQGEDGETPHGRLPIVEGRVDRLRRDVDSLMKAELSVRAYWNFTRILSHAITGFAGAVGVALIEHFLR